MSLKHFLRKNHYQDDHKVRPHRRDENDYSHPANHDESNWLVSYADMMTLLCGFFILLFSMAKMDEHKYEVVKQEIAKEFHGAYQPPDSKGLEKLVKEIVEQAGVAKDTVVKSDSSSVTVAFSSTLFFETLSADVKPEGRIVLDRLISGISARQLKENRFYKVVVEGHTDSQPIVGGTFPSNWELSGARAARVLRLFTDRGFSSRLMTVVAYGDTRPEVEARNPDGSWNQEALGKNRRVVLRIMDPNADAIPMAETSPSPVDRAPASAPSAVPSAIPAIAPSAAPSPVLPAAAPAEVNTPTPSPKLEASPFFSAEPATVTVLVPRTPPPPSASPRP